MGAFDFFRVIFSSKEVVGATAILAIVYYFVINYVISLNSPGGISFVTVPAILIYLLAISASMLLVISIYSMKFSFLRIESEAEGVISFITTLAGGIVAGCNCAVPIIASLLYLLTLNAVTVSSIIVIIGNYQIEIFAALILLNLLVSYYHLNKLSKMCTIKKGNIVKKRG